MHTLKMLFCQLGLDDEEQQIAMFIRMHRPLPPNIPLPEANFWKGAQAAFLAQAIEEDSDWCVLVDKLDCLLRENTSP